MNPNNEIIDFEALNLRITYFLNIINKLKKILIIGTTFGALLGLSYSFFKKIEYKATYTFTIEEDKQSGGLMNFGSGASGLASQLGIDLASGNNGLFAGSNIIELMKSRKIIQKTLLTEIDINEKNKIPLINYYLNSQLLNNIGYGNIKFDALKKQELTIEQDSILNLVYLDVLKNNLKVEQKNKKLSIITIDFTSKDELFSKLMCENLVDVVSNFYVEIKSKKARENFEILNKQADSIRRELENAIVGVARSSDDVYNLNPAFNTKKTPTSKRQIDVQANTAILTQLVGNLEISKINLRKETPLIQPIDKPILPLYSDKPSKIISTLIGSIIGFLLTVVFGILIQYFKKFKEKIEIK